MFCFSRGMFFQRQFHLKRFIDWIIPLKGGPQKQKESTVHENLIAPATALSQSSFALKRGYSRLNRLWPTVTRLPSCYSNCISFFKQDAMKLEESDSRSFPRHHWRTKHSKWMWLESTKKENEASAWFQFSESVIKTDKHRRLFPIPRPGIVTICSDNFPESNIWISP